ncbi:MAG: lysophospholipid acyltransferase family protein [Bacillota bacterium]|nr:lysophospholipid acyltransferase family protein [Bacillota bacterium]
MLIKIMAAMGAAATALIVFLTDLAHSGLSLLWIVPLLLLGCFIAANVVYAILILIGTELAISLKKPNDNPAKFWRWTLEALSEWLCTWGRVKVECTGLEKLPQGRFLMVCNHRSYFDPIVKIPIFKTVGMTYVSKPSNFRIPIAGKLMHAYGCLSLNRENNREALVTINRAADIISSDRASVCIYPEGTRSTKDELLPFHAGSLKSAQKAGAPVVAVTVYGTDHVGKNFPLHRTYVKVDVSAVIDADYVKSHKTHELAEITQKIIQDKYDEFAKRSRIDA